MSGENKPLVTFALFAYNQEQYIREAVEAALAQSYRPLEIIISDDCSSDRTIDVIRELVRKYDGPHKVIINKNETNLGLINHVNNVVAMSSGDLIVAAAGDDISHSDRARILAKIFYESDEPPLLIHSSVEKVSPNGTSLGIKHPPMRSDTHTAQMRKASTADSVYIGASGAWNKKLFDLFGPIVHLAAYEDIVLGSRAAMMGGLVYWPYPLLKYRMGSGITTSDQRFKGIKQLLTWRRGWIKAMEDVYLQRVEDYRRIGCERGESESTKRLGVFSAKRRMYAGGEFLAAEMRSNPIRFVLCIVTEFSSIVSIILYRILSLARPA